MSGRIAKQIYDLADMDYTAPYRERAAKALTQYSDRYEPINRIASNKLGVEVLDNAGIKSKYPSRVPNSLYESGVEGRAWDNKIWISDNARNKEALKAHELGHIAFGHKGIGYPIDQLVRETEAEGLVYGVGHKLGIPLDILAPITAHFLYSQGKRIDVSPEQVINVLESRKGRIKEVTNDFVSGNLKQGGRNDYKIEPLPPNITNEQRKKLFDDYLKLPLTSQLIEKKVNRRNSWDEMTHKVFDINRRQQDAILKYQALTPEHKFKIDDFAAKAGYPTDDAHLYIIQELWQNPRKKREVYKKAEDWSDYLGLSDEQKEQVNSFAKSKGFRNINPHNILSVRDEWKARNV